MEEKDSTLVFWIKFILLLPIFVELWIVTSVWVFILTYPGRTLTTMALASKVYVRATTIVEEVQVALKVSPPKDRTHRYVPLSQRDEENPAVFLMENLPSRKRARIQDGQFKLSSTGRVREILTVSINLKMAVHCLKGWENVTNEDGSSVEFDATRPYDMWDMLPEDIQTELQAVFGSGGYSEKAEERMVRIEAGDLDEEEEAFEGLLSDDDDADEPDDGLVED